jgi:hypothetical protein
MAGATATTAAPASTDDEMQKRWIDRMVSSLTGFHAFAAFSPTDDRPTHFRQARFKNPQKLS